MTPHKQLNPHSPAHGVWGDCYRTAIACILDVEPATVPHVMDGGTVTGDEADALMRRHLARLGYSLFAVPYHGLTLEELLAEQKRTNPDMHYMLGGISRTGCGHWVICKDGEIVHDPSRAEAGIIGPHEGGYYWTVVVVKR